MSTHTQELAERLKKNWSGPMTDKEVAFLEDVKGFIEFAIRNGLNFSMVMSGLLHDINEIARAGMSVENSLKAGIVPKVNGYGKLTSDAFGESPDDETVTQ
jgi:hypothetical protein